MTRIYRRHGMTGTKLQGVWKQMHRRCVDNNPRSRAYKTKRVQVCARWYDPTEFFRWALQHGYEEGLQIDRIDNSKDYSPVNCRWVTPKVNANNRANNIRIEHDNNVRTIAEWSAVTGIGHHTLYTRYSRGWSPERILTKEVQHRG